MIYNITNNQWDDNILRLLKIEKTNIKLHVIIIVKKIKNIIQKFIELLEKMAVLIIGNLKY